MNDESLFHLALEKPATERPVFLEQACGGDAALRQRVEALLRSHEIPDSFLIRSAENHEAITDSSSSQVAAAQGPGGTEEESTNCRSSAEGPGSRVGPYKLLQPIGEGGMGTVYMAEQTTPVRRTVALKLIKAGMDSRQVLARFGAERQALALMDHPNIAKVFDAGTTDTGRPYFVMELVKGVPITRFCDERRLTTRERLELAIPVCQAVQHAHQKGIIHRDLKPSNVLIALYDGKPVPKVIDFGVAKATGPRLTDQTLYTEFGAVVGTLEYMSPEQAELNQLDIDTRSDIYSLGVLLYELLTGSTPLDRTRLKQGAILEMLRLIREEESPRPSMRLSTTEELPSIAACRSIEPRKLSGLVRGELDWIVMKALEKDRDRRYETANGLAADLRRYLDDEPVQACPPSAWYRFRKFARRNKGPVLASAIVLLVLIGGIIGTTWGFVRAVRARHSEAEQRELAEGNERRALAAAAAEKEAKEMALTQEAETKAVLDFVENKVFAAARPQGQEGGLGREVTLRKAVEAALPFVEKSFANQPLIEARLRMTLGISFDHLGKFQIAAEQSERARVIFTKQLGPDHPHTLASMNNLANSYNGLGRYAEALKLREETRALVEAKLGRDNRNTLLSMNNLANSYYALGRYADAFKLGEETLALTSAKLGPDDPDTLRSMGSLASYHQALGRYAQALKLHEQTLALSKAKLGADHPDTLTGMTLLARTYASLGRYADALELGEEALAKQKTRLGRDHPSTLLSMYILAESYADFGQYAVALKLLEETLALRKAQLGPDHPDTLVSMMMLADTYKKLGRYAQALKLREETLALSKAKLGPNHPDTLRSMDYLAMSYAAVGRHADALKLCEEALALMKAQLGPDHPDTLSTMNNLASRHAHLGRYADALKLREEALALMKAKLGPDHTYTLSTMNNLANDYADLGRHADALKLREVTLALMKTKRGPNHPDTLVSMRNLGNSYHDHGRHADALKLREETLALSKAKLGPDHPDTLTNMNNLAGSYTHLGRHADALKLYEETLARRKAKLGPDHTDVLTSMWAVAASLAKLDRSAEAVPIIDECVRRAAGKVVDPNLIQGVIDLRLRHFEKAKDTAGCRATAEMLEKLKRTDGDSLYNAACMRAVTAAVLRAGDKSEATAKEAAVEAGRAMAWLKQAVAAGYKDVAHMATDKDLDPLRDREDFKKVVAELRARHEKGKK